MKRQLPNAFLPPVAAASAVALVLAAGCSSAQADPALAQLAPGGAVETTGKIVVEDFIGTLVVNTGPGKSFDVKVDQGAAVSAGELDAVDTRATANSVIVRGDDDARIKNCSQNDDKFRLRLKGGDKRDLADFPTVEITAPATAEIELSLRGGLVTLGDLGEADIVVTGCGDIFAGDVSNELDVAINGSGDYTGGGVGELEVAIRGSGDVNIGDVREDADLAIMGSGDINIGHVGGSLDAGVMGSGDIEVLSATGKLDAGIKGSGDITILGGDFDEADLGVAGSGDISVKGTVGELDASVAGSGDIEVETVTGERDVSSWGSGDIVANGQRWTKKGWVDD